MSDATPALTTDTRKLLISVSDLSLRYGSRRAFHPTSLDIAAGRITSIVGPSGCGKSSFLFCLNRMHELIDSAKVEGRVALDGVDVGLVNLLALRKRVGMIFQKPNPFPLSIRRNLEFPLKEHGVRSSAEVAGRVESALRQVGLWSEVKDRLNSPAMALSGGQQQRLCIARALVLEPEVLLMDEPCSALDPISSGVVEDLMQDLRSRYTIVVVTHNLAQARRISDDVAFFWIKDGSGALIEHGESGEIFERPRHELTANYVRGLRG